MVGRLKASDRAYRINGGSQQRDFSMSINGKVASSPARARASAAPSRCGWRMTAPTSRSSTSRGQDEGVADEVRAIGRKATTFKADVTKRDDVYAAVDHAEKELGGFDIMVNNAGIAQVQPLSPKSRPRKSSKILKVNVEGVLWGIQAAGEEVQGAQAEGQDHQRLVHRGPRGLRACSASTRRPSSPSGR